MSFLRPLAFRRHCFRFPIRVREVEQGLGRAGRRGRGGERSLRHRVTPVRAPDGPEEFYVLTEAALAQPQSLQRHKEQLLVAEPVRATLARQRRVFRPSPMASQFDLPVDFFNLTAEEIKREQRLRSEAVERLSVLRTKAMREREEQRETRKYTYTLLRVRLPDGCLLQGACAVASWVGPGVLPGLLPWTAAPLTVLPTQEPSTPGSGWPHCTRSSGRPCRAIGCLLTCWPPVGRGCRRRRAWPSTSAGW